MISLKCPNCDAPLEVPEGRSLYFCQFCGGQVVGKHFPQQQTHDVPARKSKSAPGIPEILNVEDDGYRLQISWRWFSPLVFFLIPFCIVWNGFLVGWYTMAMGFGGDMPGPMELLFLLFPIGHIAVGVGMTYAVLTMLFNRTTVTIEHGQLTVRHGPLPYPGNRQLFTEDVDQLYCIEEKTASKDDGGYLKYTVMALLRDGTSVKLLPPDSKRELARAVEYLVEKHLDIEDRHISGEVA